MESKPIYTVWVLRGTTWRALSSAVALRVYKVLKNALKVAQDQSRLPGVDQTEVLLGRDPTSPLVAIFIHGERTNAESDD